MHKNISHEVGHCAHIVLFFICDPRAQPSTHEHSSTAHERRWRNPASALGPRVQPSIHNSSISIGLRPGWSRAEAAARRCEAPPIDLSSVLSFISCLASRAKTRSLLPSSPRSWVVVISCAISALVILAIHRNVWNAVFHSKLCVITRLDLNIISCDCRNIKK